MCKLVSLIAVALFVGGMIAGCGNGGGDVELSPAQQQQLEELEREGMPAPGEQQPQQ